MSIPTYSADELTTRIAEGSVDVNRLAATMVQVMRTADAAAGWINEQIQAQQAPVQVGAVPSDAESGKRKR
jgi:hypothetical protein